MKTRWIFALVLSAMLVACGGSSESAKKGKEKKKPEKEETSSDDDNPLLAPLNYVGAVGKAKKSSEKRVNLANVQNAIRQFHAVEGRYPKSLNELVKEGYYSKMPAAPRGMRYVYNPKTGQVGVK
tara:strand:+ start:491 stop:865 length:375 start_codon:yes stop_codon:yes gene_type:complete